MGVEAEGLQEWIGAEVIDPDGEKLGKVEEVYYHGDTPVVVEVRSGLVGRKRNLAALAGATVTTSQLRLPTAELVPTDGGLSVEALAQLSQHDDRLAGLTVDGLEGEQARQQRRRTGELEASRADALDAQASRRAEEARKAAAKAADAAQSASEAERVHRQAEEDAAAARREADHLRQ